MNNNRAARRSCNYHRAKGLTQTKCNIAENEAYMWASIILGLSFGLMFFLGLM